MINNRFQGTGSSGKEGFGVALRMGPGLRQARAAVRDGFATTGTKGSPA
jgi:hypothetical protein